MPSFSINFSSSACTPTNSYGYVGDQFECGNGPSDTIQYALQAGGQGAEFPQFILVARWNLTPRSPMGD